MANKQKCPECRGRGEVPCTMEYGDDDHPDNCPVCGGDRGVRVPCPECGGSGEVND